MSTLANTPLCWRQNRLWDMHSPQAQCKAICPSIPRHPASTLDRRLDTLLSQWRWRASQLPNTRTECPLWNQSEQYLQPQSRCRQPPRCPSKPTLPTRRRIWTSSFSLLALWVHLSPASRTLPRKWPIPWPGSWVQDWSEADAVQGLMHPYRSSSLLHLPVDSSTHESNEYTLQRVETVTTVEPVRCTGGPAWNTGDWRAESWKILPMNYPHEDDEDEKEVLRSYRSIEFDLPQALAIAQGDDLEPGHTGGHGQACSARFFKFGGKNADWMMGDCIWREVLSQHKNGANQYQLCHFWGLFFVDYFGSDLTVLQVERNDYIDSNSSTV